MAQPLPTSLDPMSVFLLLLQHLVQRFRQMNSNCLNPMDWASAASTRALPPVVSFTEDGSYSAMVRLGRQRISNFAPQEVSVDTDRPYIVITAKRYSKTSRGESYVSRFQQTRLDFPFGPGILPLITVDQDDQNPRHTWVSVHMSVKKTNRQQDDDDDELYSIFMT